MKGWVWVGIAVLLGSCGGEAAPGGEESDEGGVPALPAVAVRDSAGVAVRTTPRGRIDALEWRIDDAPVAVFDGSEGGLEPFHLIASMAFDSDTSFVLGEMAMTRLRRYTLAGLDRTMGRSGQGPGEFGALNHIGFVRDSLLVFDSRWNRISVFDGDFQFVRSFVLDAVRGGQARFEGLFPDGRILALAAVPGEDRAWGLWDLDGRSMGLLPGIPGLPPLTLQSLAPSAAHDLPPLRPFRASRFGAEAAGRFLFIDGGDYRFELYDAHGDRRASERLELPPRPLSAETQEAWKGRTLEGMSTVTPAFRRSVEEAEFPETLPSLGNGNPLTGPTAVLDDDRGRIWVAEYPAAPPQRWFVFAAEGGLAGHLTLPDGFELEAVRGDLLLGVARDDLDRQTAVVWRFRP